jgi:hypothetical protein
MDFTFGGVTFVCEDAQSFSRVLNEVLPLGYISFLVAKTYDDPDLKQQVLDALSPFQLVSKAWAVSTLKQVNIFRTTYYPGSWFGQLATSIHHTYKNDYARCGVTVEHVLIDLDPRCSAVAKDVVTWYLTRSPWIVVGDLFTLSPPTEPSLFVWTGLEHFDLEKVRQLVHACPTGTTFLFQGTDMPAPDHINPISSSDQILLALGVDSSKVCTKGSLYSSVGNRHQVVFTT